MKHVLEALAVGFTVGYATGYALGAAVKSAFYHEMQSLRLRVAAAEAAVESRVKRVVDAL